MNYDETRIVAVLRAVFGYENFKNDVQKEATIAVNEGSKYVCISMPPSFGRSLCFQLPMVLQKNKIALIFSPKLSTMKNHIETLRSKQINARLLCHSTYINERKLILKDLTSNFPTIVLLYCTLEMATVTYFQKLVLLLQRRKMLSYIVFNEAHCLSEWGYEYAPCYKRINMFDNIYGQVSKIAVTTTVTDKVIEDICKLLTLEEPKIFKMPVQQINVHCSIWFSDILSDPFKHLKSFIVEILGSLDPSACKIDKGFAIVYCREETTAELVKTKLNVFGVSSLIYHHKLNNSIRLTIENKWISGEAQVIITTYDYGFIHKNPIRCIVYWTIPENIPKYYRQCAQMHVNNSRAYCRIYFSIKEYSSIKLNIENHRQIKDPNHIKIRLSEYDKLVSYCLFAKCRHIVINEYFGHIISPCEVNCDVCESKEKIKIRTQKFIAYSENIQGIKYNICDLSENLRKDPIGDNNKDQSKEIVKNQIDCREISVEWIDGKGIVQCSNKLEKNEEELSFSKSSSSVMQFCTKCIIRSTKGVRRMKNNTNVIRAGERVITPPLVDKYKLNKEVISLRPCSTKNNVSEYSRGRSKTRASSDGSELRDQSRIRDANNDGKIKTDEERDRISKNTSREVTIAVEAKEHGKKLGKRSNAVNTCLEEFQLKRRKLGTESKPINETRRKNGETCDRDRRMKRIKDDANERVSRDHTTAEYLMNKYKLDRDSITLELRRK